MANDLHTGTEPSLTGLVTGIINDAQELLKQQVALFKQEVKDDIRKTKEAAVALIAVWSAESLQAAPLYTLVQVMTVPPPVVPPDVVPLPVPTQASSALAYDVCALM